MREKGFAKHRLMIFDKNIFAKDFCKKDSATYIDVEEPDDGNIQIAATVLLQCVEETI